MAKHLDADIKRLCSCSDVEKPHFRYCIQRTKQFLDTDTPQLAFDYGDHPVPRFDFEGV